jgi:hypothetical protein
MWHWTKAADAEDMERSLRVDHTPWGLEMGCDRVWEAKVDIGQLD